MTYVRSVVFMILLGAACQLCPAGTWYVPMADKEFGGFDAIQILMAPGYQFDSPAMSVFFGLDSDGNRVPAGEEWSEFFLNDKRDFATAIGPNLHTDILVFDIWIDGDRQVDRPLFHYQTYREGLLIGNWDITCTGPGDFDWDNDPGTWLVDTLFPPWLPGDADFDTDVDIDDIGIWQIHYTGPGGTGMQWGDGDWDGDGDVDIDDVSLWQLNYTGPHAPEPVTLIVMAAGLPVLLKRSRRWSGQRKSRSRCGGTGAECRGLGADAAPPRRQIA